MGQIKHKRSCFDRYGWPVVISLLVMASAFLLPRYWGQFERLRAMSMQAMMINVMIAQDQYRAAQGKYTSRWNELLPYVAQPTTLEPELEAVAAKPQTYFFGFGKNAIRKHRGYWVSLQLEQDQNSGMITAVRTNNLFYHYEISRPFPQGEVACRAKGMSRGFCKRFLANVEELDLKNLVPVPNEKTEGAENQSGKTN